MPNNPSTDGIDHRHGIGDVLTKPDSSEWKVTNRLIDVDTGELVYRLREENVPGTFRELEVLAESEVVRIFDVEAVEGGDSP